MCLVKVWAVVVTQLVKQSLPTSEVRGSNPVIGKLLYRAFNCLPTVNCIEKKKINKKGPGMAHFLKVYAKLLLGYFSELSALIMRRAKLRNSVENFKKKAWKVFSTHPIEEHSFKHALGR